MIHIYYSMYNVVWMNFWMMSLSAYFSKLLVALVLDKMILGDLLPVSSVGNGESLSQSLGLCSLSCVETVIKFVCGFFSQR